ncbi:MAG: CBS domain-containing protein [Deltaproteobacteria bacterium]|nr:CBS domain-containing protein [Deltaproteobacteria bacterium]
MGDLSNGAEINVLPPDLARMPRRVGELMTTQVVSLYPHNLFREAVDLMAHHSFHHLLVAEPDGRLAGVLSDRDILRAEGCYDSDSTLVADLMVSQVFTVQAQTPLSEAVELVLDHRLNCLPVVDDSGKICGIITTTDILNAFKNLQSAVENIS